VGIAPQVFDNVFGTVKRAFGVDMPVLGGDTPQQTVDGFGVFEVAEAIVPAATVVDTQSGKHLAAKDATQSFDGKEKSLVCRSPRAVGTPAATGHDAMHVWVEPKLLVPRMQDNRCSDGCVKATLAKGVQGRCSTRKEQPEHHLRREGCQRAQLRRQRKDDVKVRNIEQPMTLLLNPLLLRERLTLRAMSIAARVVGRMLVPAGLTDIEMTAERGRAALPDVCQYASLLGVEANLLLQSTSVLTDDIGKLEAWRPGTGRHCYRLG
jgi:hypothetical protein